MCVRGITVCVEYDDLLRITLAKNLRHLSEVLVVTSPADTTTQELVRATPGAKLHVTDAFYRQDAVFNKGLAMEEGFDVLGRTGWILVFDADILLPDSVDWKFLVPGCLYTPERHMLANPRNWYEGIPWTQLPVKAESEHAGFFQAFHAEHDPVKNLRPWYGTDWWHAGGCDSVFQAYWQHQFKKRPPFRVLHLGLDCKNWCGRVTPKIDGGDLADHDKRADLMKKISTDWTLRRSRLPKSSG